MPKFLIQATYPPEGTKGLLREGASGRRAAVSLTVKAGDALHTRATPLLTVEEIDEATRRRVGFRAPGQ
jgi:hypothetical protein